MKFSEAIKSNFDSFCAFEVLYWCGLRLGELLALTGKDIDFANKTMTINKSYQRLGKKDYITEPKTEKSNRVISLPDFLCEELCKYLRRKRRFNFSTQRWIADHQLPALSVSEFTICGILMYLF